MREESSFFGREYLLRSLLQAGAQGRWLGLCGGPSSGKTSTLRQLLVLSRRQWKRAPQETPYVPVLVDLNECRGAGAAQLPALIWRQVTAALREPTVRGGAGEIEMPTPAFTGREGDPWQVLMQSCEELWGGLRGREGWCRYFLCVDNADLLLSGQFKHSLGPLVEFVERGEDFAPCGLIVAGSRVLREYLVDDLGYFHKSVRPVFLSPLLEAPSESMIRATLSRVTPAQLQVIQEMTGNHPRLLSLCLHEIRVSGALGSVHSLMRRVSLAAEGLFEEIWEQFDLGRGVTYRGAYAAPEHALMQLLIDQKDQGTTVKEAERELGLRPLADYFELLELLGVVERTLRGDQRVTRARCRLWNQWYLDRISL